jgi:hypothetical protein
MLKGAVQMFVFRNRLSSFPLWVKRQGARLYGRCDIKLLLNRFLMHHALMHDQKYKTCVHSTVSYSVHTRGMQSIVGERARFNTSRALYI